MVFSRAEAVDGTLRSLDASSIDLDSIFESASD
jgi:hypothetical protein